MESSVSLLPSRKAVACKSHMNRITGDVHRLEGMGERGEGGGGAVVAYLGMLGTEVEGRTTRSSSVSAALPFSRAWAVKVRDASYWPGPGLAAPRHSVNSVDRGRMGAVFAL